MTTHPRQAGDVRVAKVDEHANTTVRRWLKLPRGIGEAGAKGFDVSCYICNTIGEMGMP